MRTILQLVNLVMTAAFLLGVVVQYNDPDPIVWMAIYGAAFLASLSFATGRCVWLAYAVIAVIAILWAAGLASSVLGITRVAEMFAAWKMGNERIEIAREFWGLVIITVWMSVLTVAAHWQTRRAK